MKPTIKNVLTDIVYLCGHSHVWPNKPTLQQFIDSYTFYKSQESNKNCSTKWTGIIKKPLYFVNAQFVSAGKEDTAWTWSIKPIK